MSQFLEYSNTNHVLQEILKGLGEKGIQVDVKEIQNKVKNFMIQVSNKYPNGNTQQMNQYVITTSINKYSTLQKPKPNISQQFEQELANRTEYARPKQPQPQQLQPTRTQDGGAMTLQQVMGVSGTSQLQQPLAVNVPMARPTTPVVRGVTAEEIIGDKYWISLGKNDLTEHEQNRFTFCWESLGKSCSKIRLKYLSIPRTFSSLLVDYGGDDKKFYNASGKNFSCKLIPTIKNLEMTTYQSLGDSSKSFSDNPNSFTFQIDQKLNLNQILVKKVVKTGNMIDVLTYDPHNMTTQDQLTLEFPAQRSCYKVAGLQIINATQIKFNSPFSGYFSSDFKLLRNNWNIDVTLECTT